MLNIYYKIIYLIETVLNILMVIAFNILRINQRTHFPKNTYSTIHILGNGPSLKDDLSKIVSYRKNSCCMVVNGFAQVDLYEKIKPEFYVIVDPNFFKNSNNERIKNGITNITKALIEKTNWKVQLFVPFSAKKSDFCKKISANNSFIEIVYFKNIPVIGGLQGLNNFLFKYNLANPLFANVLIAAIFFCIKIKFSKIYLWGADNSWHENYRLGNDNFIYREDKHFYDSNNKGEMIVLKNPDGSPTKVYQEFFNFSSVSKIYHSLESFSKKSSSKIINLSSKTWIDAFSRIF